MCSSDLDCFVPVTLVVVGRGSSSTTTSGTNSGSGAGAGVTGAEEVTSITGSAGCGGSWTSVVCSSAGLRFLANTSAIVGCEEVTIFRYYWFFSANGSALRSNNDGTFRLLCDRVTRLGTVDMTHEDRWLREGV